MSTLATTDLLRFEGAAGAECGRARELVDQGNPLEAACHIIILEDQLAEAQRINAQLTARDPRPPR